MGVVDDFDLTNSMKKALKTAYERCPNHGGAQDRYGWLVPNINDRKAKIYGIAKCNKQTLLALERRGLVTISAEVLNVSSKNHRRVKCTPNFKKLSTLLWKRDGEAERLLFVGRVNKMGAKVVRNL